MDISRFKNYGLWVAVAALIPLLLKSFGINVIPEDYQEIVNSILAILVMAGILNNPTTESKWYKDDKSQEMPKLEAEKLEGSTEVKEEKINK